MRDKNSILLESGTNEVEVLEFNLGGQGFGVNVLKVQAIEQYDPNCVTEIQLAHPAVIGTYSYRDGVITLVDLGLDLDVRESHGPALAPADNAAIETVLAAVPAPELPGAQDVPATTAVETAIETRIVLVLEFNERTTGFLVDGVNRIHRINWNAISPMNPFLAAVHSKFTGSINIDGREILIMDMERILTDILPETASDYHLDIPDDLGEDQRRAQIPVLLAEDSATIRSLLTKELKRGGYTNLSAFDNGLSCYEKLEELVGKARAENRPVKDVVGIIVSDIEMPRMDGMTLCRRAKNDLALEDIPVVLFSSLINEQIARKCESVGADAYISKPRFNELLAKVDSYALGG